MGNDGAAPQPSHSAPVSAAPQPSGSVLDSVVSAGNVCDRLYNLAQEKQNKDHAKARSKKVSEETASRQPRINSKSRLLVQQKKQKQRGGLKVEDRLLATGAKYRQKADTRAKAVKSHEVECRHRHSCNAFPSFRVVVDLLVEPCCILCCCSV